MKTFFVAALAVVAISLSQGQKAESEADRTMMWPVPKTAAASVNTPCNPPQPATGLYPYGTCNGDLQMYRTDDGGASVRLSSPMVIFGKSYTQLWVSNNGLLSFGGRVYTFTPRRFPINYNRYGIIAPYWADVDTRYPGSGSVFYRQIVSGPGLLKAQRDVEDALPGIPNFRATSAFVATWHGVTFYGARTFNNTVLGPRNTFQVVIVSDGPRTYSFFYYNKLTWTTGRASGGDLNGLSGTRAEVGFDAGDRINYYVAPWSFQHNIMQMTSVTNVNGPHTGRNGCWFSQYNLIGELARIMTCLQRRTCCVMKGNLYTPRDNCQRFEQWDYLNHPYRPGFPAQDAADGTVFDTNPTVCTGNYARNVNCVS